MLVLIYPMAYVPQEASFCVTTHLLPAGLLITYMALNMMDGHGQPALLYIVPFTLGKEQVCLLADNWG